MSNDRIRQYYEDNRGDVYKVLRYAILNGDCRKVRSIIKSGQVDLRNEHKTGQEPLLFSLLESSHYRLSQRKEIIQLMVAHGADIHIEYEDVNILTPAWGTSAATIEFLLSEYKFSNEEMLKAFECTYWQGNEYFIRLKELYLFQKHGLKLNTKTAEALLFEAVDRYDTEMTEFLLEHYKISANCTNEAGFTPLHKVSDDSGEGAWHESVSKYRKIVKILLAHGADIDCKGEESGITPLMLASDIDVFKFLLKQGANIHAVTRETRQNILMRQAENRYQPLPIVKLLVEKYHFDVKQKDKNGTPVLTFALKTGKFEVVNYLIEKGAASGISDIDEYAQKFSNSEFWRCLIKYGLQADEHGKNILFYAKPNKQSMLLQMGVDASIVANDGTTLLMNSELGYNNFHLLVKHGADPTKTPGGTQGLFTWWLNQESKLEREDILLYLIQQYSLDPDTRDKDGRTALFYAGFTVPDLLDLGASPDLVDNTGNTILMYWLRGSHGGIPESLFKNLNHQNNEGKTALHYAVKHEQPSMIQNLLDHGVDCNIKDNSGKTALDYAREWKRTDLYDLLENYGTMKQHN